MLAGYELNRERDEELFCSAACDNVCPVHFHRKVEVMYVLSGSKTLTAAGKELTLDADSIFFANSYEMHGYAESPGSIQTVIVFPNRMLGDYYAVFGEKMPLGSVVTDAEFCRSLLPDFEALAGGECNPLLKKAHCDFILGSLMDKLGYTDGVKEFLAANPDAFDPKKYGKVAMEKVKEIVKLRMTMCGCVGKA